MPINELKGAVMALAALILFLYGIEHLGREVQRVGGHRLKSWISAVTRTPWMGFLSGLVATALLQSSTAVSVLATTLVQARILAFTASLGVLIGSNVGTTLTAQLVSLKLTEFAPIFIVLGGLFSLGPDRLRIFGKSIFYFGFVFFALDLLSDTLLPFSSSPEARAFLEDYSGPVLGVLSGIVFTAVFQSSSVTTGIAVLLVQTGVLGLPTALPMVIGANAGTTVTAILASLRMDPPARRTAVAHVVFNLVGVLIFLPFLVPYGHLLERSFTDPAKALAWGHTGFNLITAALFLALIRPYERLVVALVPDAPAGLKN